MDLITLALMGGAAYLFQGKKTSDKLEYYPKSIIYSKTRKELVFYMEILNPTTRDLKVDSFFGGFFFNDIKVGSVERANPFTIKKKDRTTVSFPVKIVWLGFTNVAISLIKDPKQEKVVKILGVARCMGMDNSINDEIPLTLKAKDE